MARLKNKKPARKQASGGSRLKASGKVAVLLGLLREDAQKIREAAKIEKRPVTQFLVYYGLKAAEKILEKKESDQS